MKKINTLTKVIASFATSFLLAVIFAGAVNEYVEVNPIYFGLAIALPVTGLGLLIHAIGETTKIVGMLTMALQPEVWIEDIQENLFPKNSFMEMATNHDMFISNLTVHIPQAGADPAIYKNNNNTPISITERTDTDFTYDIDNYKAEPILIRNLDELQLSYSKRMSIMRNYYSTIGYAVENQTLYKWAPSGASRIVRTTGAAVGTALAPSATGTRNAITLADVLSLKGKLDKDEVPEEGRILLIPSDIYNNQLLAISNIQQYYAYNLPVTQDGKVPTLFGFKVMTRSSVAVYDTTPVPKSVNSKGIPSSPAATDNLACIAYHPDFVSKARGTINVYTQENAPEYYGSILSMEVQHGASPLRSTSIGIAALVQQ